MYRVRIHPDEITDVLNRLSAALTDLLPLMTEIGEQLEHTTEERFDRGVGPDGRAWAPKSQTTIDAYARRKQRVDRRPLWGPGEGGHLARSIHRAVGVDFVEIGTNAIQSAVMQYGARQGAFGRTRRGAPIPWGNIPARPFIGLSDLDRSNIAETLDEWL